MYIKLTRMNGVPIWFNAAFIVTVEPAVRGGATVVPIGDGLDYDVRETPEQVLAMLDGAPAPTVVPVPAPHSLTKTPDDVSPEPEKAEKAGGHGQDARATGDAGGHGQDARATGKVAEKPAKKTRGRKKAVATEEKKAEVSADPAAENYDPFAGVAEEPETVTVLGLDADQLSRLRKLAPRSLKKLVNTLTSQFKSPDPEGIVQSLVDAGIVTVDRERVLWKAPAADSRMQG